MRVSILGRFHGRTPSERACQNRDTLPDQASEAVIASAAPYGLRRGVSCFILYILFILSFSAFFSSAH